MIFEEEANDSELFVVFNGGMTPVTAEIIGHKTLRDQRKGSAFWTDDMEAIDRKTRVYDMLQRNMRGNRSEDKN